MKGDPRGTARHILSWHAGYRTDISPGHPHPMGAVVPSNCGVLAWVFEQVFSSWGQTWVWQTKPLSLMPQAPSFLRTRAESLVAVCCTSGSAAAAKPPLRKLKKYQKRIAQHLFCFRDWICSTSIRASSSYAGGMPLDQPAALCPRKGMRLSPQGL